MSSRRCGYCYQTGHNQRTCPKKTEAIKKRHDREVADGRTDSYWIREYQKRVAPKGTKGKKVKNQTCGYCRTHGHTRRKCLVLESDKALYAKHHNMIVDICHDYIQKSPIGIGSLFCSTGEVWEKTQYVKKKRMFVVTDITLSEDLWGTEPQPILVMREFNTGEIARKRMRGFVRGAKDSNYYNKFDLVSAEAQPIPSNWVADHRTNVAKLAQHVHFKRVGRKQEDMRAYGIQNFVKYQERAQQPDNWGYENAKDMLTRWSEDCIRHHLFKDFLKHV